MNKPAVILRGDRLVRTAAPIAASPVSAPAADDAPAPPLKAGTRIAILLFVVALCLPFNWNLGGLRLTPVTLLLLVGALPLLSEWLFKRPNPLGPADRLVLGFWLWATIGIVYHHGLGEAVQPVGMHFLQTVAAFAAGRVLIRDERSMRFMVAVVVVALIVATPFALVEALTGRPLILNIASTVGSSLRPVNMSPRLGLHRVQGFFEHPILFGVFTASIFSLAAFALAAVQRQALRWTGVAAATLLSILSLSTGALLAVNVQIGLIAWRRIFRSMEKRWLLLGGIVAMLWIAIDLGSTRTPFHVFVNYATFSSGSSYNRILIWQFGSAEALRHPFFGIGFNEWQRPRYMSDSMDNFWLLQAVRYGIPAFLMLFGAVLAILIGMGRRRGPGRAVDLMRTGASFAIIGTIIAICSVHLWNSTYIWLLFLLGACAWLAQPAPAGPPAAKQPRRAIHPSLQPRR